MALSQEELFVAMVYLKAEQFPGLDLESFKELEEQKASLMISVAERALIARGFLRPDANQQWQLETKVQGLLAACLWPDRSIFVYHTRPQSSPEEYFFHAYQRMYILHSIPVTAIHQFIAVEDKSAIARSILSILNLPSVKAVDCGTVRINLDLFEMVRDAALEQDSEKAQKLLAGANLEQKFAAEMSSTLSSMIANTTFVIHDHKTDRSTQGLSILQSQNALWWLTPTEEDDETIYIESLSSEEIIQRMKNLLL